MPSEQLYNNIPVLLLIFIILSGFIPKVLGILVMIGCFSYLADCSVALLIPRQKGLVTDILMLLLAIGELSMVGWLLIKGVKVNQGIS